MIAGDPTLKRGANKRCAYGASIIGIKLKIRTGMHVLKTMVVMSLLLGPSGDPRRRRNVC